MKWWAAHLSIGGIVVTLAYLQVWPTPIGPLEVLIVGLLIGLGQATISSIQLFKCKTRIVLVSGLGFFAGWLVLMLAFAPIIVSLILLIENMWEVVLPFEWMENIRLLLSFALVHFGFGISLGILMSSIAVFQLISLDKNPVQESSWIKANMLGSIIAMISIPLVKNATLPSDWTINLPNLVALLIGITLYTVVTYKSAQDALDDQYLRRNPFGTTPTKGNPRA